MAVYLHYYKFLVRYSHASGKYSNLLFKQIANIIQLKNASLILARMDAHDHSKRD